MEKLFYFVLLAIGVILAAWGAVPDLTPTLEPVIVCAFTGPHELPCKEPSNAQ